MSAGITVMCHQSLLVPFTTSKSTMGFTLGHLLGFILWCPLQNSCWNSVATVIELRRGTFGRWPCHEDILVTRAMGVTPLREDTVLVLSTLLPSPREDVARKLPPDAKCQDVGLGHCSLQNCEKSILDFYKLSIQPGILLEQHRWTPRAFITFCFKHCACTPWKGVSQGSSLFEKLTVRNALVKKWCPF
jgi:hypothetical protein